MAEQQSADATRPMGEAGNIELPKKFEGLVTLLNARGRYPIMVMLIMTLINSYAGSVTLSQTFTRASTDFTCNTNATIAANATDCSLSVSDDQCSVSVNCSNAAWSQACTHWTFNTSEFTETIITKFQLVCSTAYLADLTGTIFFAGFLIGSTLFGIVSDSFGRQIGVISSLLCMATFTIVAAFAPSYWLCSAAMLLSGAGTGGVLIAAFPFAAECTDNKHRVLWIYSLSFGWVFGVLLMIMVAYLERSYRYQLLWISVAVVIYLPLTILTGESPRWLFSTNKLQRADATVLRIAKINGTRHKLPQNFTVADLIDEESEDGAHVSSRATVVDLFRTFGMRKITLLSWIQWFVASMTYYGISLGVGTIGGDIFLNATFVNLVELPARALGMIVLQCNVGRKPVLYISFILSAVAMGGVAGTFELEHLQTVRVVLAVFGKLCITAAFDCVWLYYCELFPTVIRTVGIGSGSTVARLGAMLSTQLLPLSNYWKPLPFLIFGIGPFIACLVMYFLPETLGQTLPETIEDGERFIKGAGKAKIGVKFPLNGASQSNYSTT